MKMNNPSAAKPILSALLTLVLSGCGNAVSQPGDGERIATMSVQWVANARRMAPMLRPIVTADGSRVCTVSGNGTALLWAADTGELEYPPVRLSDSRFDSYTAGAGCDDSIIAAVDSDGRLFVYNTATKTLLWQKDLKTRVFGTPLITRGRLFNIGLDGRLLAFTLKKGRELWRYVSPLENLVRTPMDSALTIANDTIYGGIDNGAIVALDLSSGKTLWENSVSAPGGNNEIANILDVTTPVVHGNTVCTAAYASGVACFNAADGERLWYRALSAYTRVAFDRSGKRLFATDVDGVLYAFHAENGELLWQNKTGADLSAPVAVEHLVLVGAADGFVHAYFIDNGEAGAFLNLSTDRILNLTVLPNSPGDVLALSMEGALFRLHAQPERQ